LYTQVADLADDSGENDIAYQQYVKVLTTYEGDDSSTADARKLALKVLRNAFHQTNKYDFQDLTSQDAVQSLRKTDSKMSDLLDIFTSETLDEYDEFKTDNADWLKEEELDTEILERKIRLLTLASLAASSGQTRSLPYSKIAEALQIEETEVEMWVIDVIRAGLVEGKLSQLNKTFLIHRSTYRVFGDNQWREIAARLDMWKTSLTGVLGVIRQERAGFKSATSKEQPQQNS
jgi:translation initiation factor 3 subunit M